MRLAKARGEENGESLRNRQHHVYPIDLDSALRAASAQTTEVRREGAFVNACVNQVRTEI